MFFCLIWRQPWFFFLILSWRHLYIIYNGVISVCMHVCMSYHHGKTAGPICPKVGEGRGWEWSGGEGLLNLHLMGGEGRGWVVKLLYHVSRNLGGSTVNPSQFENFVTP